MKTVQSILTDYINTPHVKSFQSIAGSRLEHLGKRQQWSILAILSRATAVAKSSGSESVNTLDALSRSEGLIPSGKTIKCIESLNGFPSDRVEQLIDAIENIRPLNGFSPWSD